MFTKIKEFFNRAWEWIQALWAKHDEQLETMVASILPMVAAVAWQENLSGEEKRKALVDAILDNAEDTADSIATSMLNEAVEIAANRYNIQIGKLTNDQMDKAVKAAIKAGRDFANKTLDLSGQEGEKAGIVLPKTLDNADL